MDEREVSNFESIQVATLDPTSPSGYCPLMRIVMLHLGKDAVERSAELKTSSRILTVC